MRFNGFLTPDAQPNQAATGQTGGPVDWQQIVASLEPNCLQRGDTSAPVQRLQRLLQALGLYSGLAEGYFDAATEASVRRLQQQFGITETGSFDAATWYALSFWVAPSSKQPQKPLDPEMELLPSYSL